MKVGGKMKLALTLGLVLATAVFAADEPKLVKREKRVSSQVSFTLEETSGNIDGSSYFKIIDVAENVVCYGARGAVEGGRAITCMTRQNPKLKTEN